MSRTPRRVTPTFPCVSLISAGVLVLMVAGCGGSDSPTELESPIAAVIVSPGNDTLWVAEARSFTVRAEDSQGNPVSGANFTWTSSNTSVAAVDIDAPGGFVVSGVAEGVATITATAEGKSGTATVTVRVLRLTSVDPGTFVSCGLAPGGAAYCWGQDVDGLLAVGPTTETCQSFRGPTPCSTSPAAVRGGLTFASLSVANGFTCGLNTSGAAYCWGLNNDGRLGTGDTLRTAVPVAVVGGLIFTSVSAGGAYACGLTATGAAYCWGSNRTGQLGTTLVADTCLNRFTGNAIPCSTTPVAVAGGLTFTSLSAAETGDHTCGVTAAGTAYCWGSDARGQLPGGGQTSEPRAVSGGLNFISVSPGGSHTCGVTTSGEAYCWGGNELGQLGDGSDTDHTTPLPVSGGLVFGSVSAGRSHTCGVATNGSVNCWGNNFYGQVGDGTGSDQRLVPTAVAGGLTFASVSVSWFHTCGHTTGGVGYCWGDNEFGQLGNGGTTVSNTPVRILGQP